MQKTISVELFGAATNNAVIRLPGRAYPGVLIQGDALASLVASVREIEGLLNGVTSGNDLADRVVDIRERLEGTLSWYEQTLSDAGLTLPYVKSELD